MVTHSHLWITKNVDWLSKKWLPIQVDKAARDAYSQEVVEKLDSDVSSMYNDSFATTPTYAYPLIDSYVNQLSEEECRERLKTFYADHFISGYHQGLKDYLLSVIEKDK